VTIETCYCEAGDGRDLIVSVELVMVETCYCGAGDGRDLLVWSK
jgi:hypothetical protein